MVGCGKEEIKCFFFFIFIVEEIGARMNVLGSNERIEVLFCLMVGSLLRWDFILFEKDC